MVCKVNYPKFAIVSFWQVAAISHFVASCFFSLGVAIDFEFVDIVGRSVVYLDTFSLSEPLSLMFFDNSAS